MAKVLELQLQPFQWIFRIDFLYDWLFWSLCCPMDSQESSPAPQFESIHSSVFSLLYGPTLTSVYDYWKNHGFDYMVLCQRSDVSALNTLSRLVIAFLPRSKHLLISWLQSLSTVILETKKIKSVTISIISHLFGMKWWDRMPWSSFSECWALSQLFHSPLSLGSFNYFLKNYLC